jgi:ABC-type glycerol-3-phosphate transport system permease component
VAVRAEPVPAAAGAWRPSRDFATKLVVYVVLIAFSALMVLPFVWMVSSSLKPFEEIFAGNSFFPEHPTFHNYVSFFRQTNALHALWNSFYIATLATALSLFLCAIGGYGFAKFRFPGRSFMFGFVIATLAIPFAVIVVPLFVMMRNTFHWVDTPLPLIIPWAANAFGIFFMRQYMLTIPDELIDAGRVDGASELGIFFRIVLPIARPALISLGIIFFISSWNNFLWPLVVLPSPDHWTLPLLLRSLQGPPGRTPYDVLMAGSVVSTLPLIIGFLIFQRRLVAGILAGTVKG